MVAELGEAALCGRRRVETKISAYESGSFCGGCELEPDDAFDVGGRERAEREDLIDPVVELGAEVRAHLPGKVTSRGLTEAGRTCIGDAKVRRHHDQRRPEIDEASALVGEATLAEDAKEEIEHLGVCFLDLVEEHERQRLLAHAGREARRLSAGAREAHRGSGQHVFAHVEPDHPLLAAERRAGELFGELGLANAGRADEEERAARSLGIDEVRLEAREHAAASIAGFVLPDDARFQEPSEIFCARGNVVGEKR